MKNKNKQALITGILGQDGSYLTQNLLENGYEVYGTVSGSILDVNYKNFDKLGISKESVKIIPFDEIKNIIEDGFEIYNLASQSSVGESWNKPIETFEANLNLYIQLLEIVSQKKVKILQASSAEMFGESENLLTEETRFSPSNPYSLSKYSAHRYGQIQRQAKGLFISNAILFPHESILRDNRFVTRKIIESAIAIRDGKLEFMELGDIEIERDWGHASDYVEAMRLILSLNYPDDYIISTGKSHSIRDWVNTTFKKLGIKFKWEGAGLDEIAVDEYTGKTLVRINSEFIRPNAMKKMQTSSNKLFKLTNWKPQKSIEDIIDEMIADTLNNK